MLDTTAGEYYKLPNELHRVVNVYEFSVMAYIFRLSNGVNGFAYPSYKTIGGVCGMSERKANLAVDSLIAKGFLNKTTSNHKSNHYTIGHDAIQDAILKALPSKELGARAKREYTDNQRDAMTIQRGILKPELAHRIESKLGNTVIQSETGELLASPRAGVE